LATLTPRHVGAIERAGIDVVVLYGSGAECVDGFLARERALGRGVGTADAANRREARRTDDAATGAAARRPR